MSYPVDTGRKLNVHKALRRRPGRLLKVLCTFNLGPVSTRQMFRGVFKTLSKPYEGFCVSSTAKNLPFLTGFSIYL